MLDNLFAPKNIAVVGVSSDPKKIGSIIFSNIISSGYTGRIYPVNPKYEWILNRKCFQKVSDIEEEIDLVVISVPSIAIEAIVDDCINKKVKNVVIITAGFSETGEQGRILEEKITDRLKQAKIRMLGPNCLGFISTKTPLNASFANASGKKGNIAFLSQSGALCTFLIDKAAQENIGFSHLISLGNKSDINEIELIEYFNEDPEVKVIGLYLEEIENGDVFYKTLLKVKKPVVLLAPGKSKQAQKAMHSHTGSLATSFEFISRAVIQSGNIIADDPNDLYNLLKVLSLSKPIEGKRVAIVTNAGGVGVISTDLIEEYKLEVAELSQETMTRLKEVLPSESSVSNPIDMLGTALANNYSKAIEICSTDANVDIIIPILTPQLITQIEETAKDIVSISETITKPAIPVFLGGRYVSYGLQRLFDFGIPGFDSLDDLLRSISKITHRKSIEELSESEKTTGKYFELVDRFATNEEKSLDSETTFLLAEELGITLPQQEVVYTRTAAVEFANKVSYPVVLKAQTKDIAHKTELKAVYINIRNEEQLKETFSQLIEDISKVTGDKNPGCLIQEQIIGGEELIIGIKRDGSSAVYKNDEQGFGHLILFGKGGIYTELYKDFSTRLLPVPFSEFIAMISETKIVKVLSGYRGKKGYNLDELIEMLDKISQLALNYPQISSLDVNPLIITDDRTVAVDLKIFVKK